MWVLNAAANMNIEKLFQSQVDSEVQDGHVDIVILLCVSFQPTHKQRRQHRAKDLGEWEDDCTRSGERQERQSCMRRMLQIMVKVNPLKDPR